MASSPYDAVVRAANAVVAGEMRPVALGIRDGRIATLDADARAHGERQTCSYGTTRCCSRGWSTPTSTSTSRAAPSGKVSSPPPAPRSAGGVTTIVDMPLNSIPPTTSVDALHTKREAAAGQADVDVGFWGGAVPGNVADLAGLHGEGVFGFKCFLLPSGVEEFPELDGPGLQEAMAELARLDALLIVHAEDGTELLAESPTGRRYDTFLRSRPPRRSRSRSTGSSPWPPRQPVVRTSSTCPAPTHCR